MSGGSRSLTSTSTRAAVLGGPTNRLEREWRRTEKVDGCKVSKEVVTSVFLLTKPLSYFPAPEFLYKNRWLM